LNVNIANSDGWMPLMLAARRGRDNTVGWLMRGWTAVHMSAHYGHLGSLSQMLDAVSPADDFQDSMGDNPLHVALRAGRSECAAAMVVRIPEWSDQANHEQLRPRDMPGYAQLPLEDARADARANARHAGDTHRETLACEEVSGCPGLCSFVVKSCGGVLGGAVADNVVRANFRHELQDLSLAVPPDGRAVEAWEVAQSRDGVVVMLRRLLDPHLREDWRAAKLGQGSFGCVFLARLGQELVAVKVSSANVSNERARGTRARVAERECHVAAAVQTMPHPCLVRVFGVYRFAEDSMNALVMEYCSGEDLQVVLKRGIAKDVVQHTQTYKHPGWVLRIWLPQIFLGLEHVHRRMLKMYRDLNPKNVVIDSRDCAKLTDFGIASLANTSQGPPSLSDAPLGVSLYMAPEVKAQMRYDSKADLFSFGVLVHTAYTGGWYCSVRPVENVRDSLNGVEGVVRGVRPPLSDFLAGLTDADPEQRFGHEDIRAHAWMTDRAINGPFEALGPLPRYDEPISSVSEWSRVATELLARRRQLRQGS